MSNSEEYEDDGFLDALNEDKATTGLKKEDSNVQTTVINENIR